MKRFTLLAAAIAAAVLLGAAGPASAQTSALPTITISLTGSAITVGGALQSGAVNITSTTTTAKGAEPTLLHLNPGVTAEQALVALPRLPDPNEAAPFGTIVFDAEAPRGTSTVQTVLPAGDYLALDTHGNNPTKFPHTTFTVAPSAQPASLPAAKASVHAIEFSFKAPRTLHRGEVVRFQNDGFLVHMIVAVRAKSTRDANRISALLRAGKDSKAEKLATGFASFMDPVSRGAVQQLTISAKPGIYVLACFMDTQDHREHTRLGMLRTIRITK